MSLLGMILLMVTQIFDPNIRTLRMRYYDVENELVELGPDRCMLVLNDGVVSAAGDRNGKVLEISFDEMSHDPQMYTYSIVHLNRHGDVDELVSGEYLQGFTTKDIVDYTHSFNTSRLYTHYSFTVPNEDMTLTASGNYAIVVYESGYPERRKLVQRFEVVDPQVCISADIRANTDIEFNGRYQQLDISIGQLQGGDISREYTIEVRQNGRTDNAIKAPRPTYIESSRMRWQNCRALIFEAGNEYRHIDLYSRMMAGTNVDRIRYDHRDYHAFLFPTLNREHEPYMHEFDADGQFLINAERTEDADTEAEYMWTHFVLPMDEPLLDRAIYVQGEWNQNRCDIRSQMDYDNENRCYYLTTLLKQGGYDFRYTYGDGNHWQTENTYHVYVYRHPVSGRYDELVGVGTFISQ